GRVRPEPGFHQLIGGSRPRRRTRPFTRSRDRHRGSAATGAAPASADHRCRSHHPLGLGRAGMKGTVAKLVAFVVVCLIFTSYLAFTIGNIHLFRKTYKLSAHFDDVSGLLPDDNVKVAGVVVGKVSGIKIDKGRARVTFTVKNDLRLPSDTEAAVR